MSMSSIVRLEKANREINAINVKNTSHIFNTDAKESSNTVVTMPFVKFIRMGCTIILNSQKPDVLRLHFPLISPTKRLLRQRKTMRSHFPSLE